MRDAEDSAKRTAKMPVNVIVTARVPAEIKEQGNAVLKKIGATPTQLVNAAYRYALKNNELPIVECSLDELARKKRVLSAEQKDLLRGRMRRTTFEVPVSYWQDKSDDEMLEEALKEKYETFA